ncbi:MAG: hypothetical protein INR70_10895 [Parafilimonas terrae]|nr:hypothetical protein [Parafilimonas terrae]
MSEPVRQHGLGPCPHRALHPRHAARKGPTLDLRPAICSNTRAADSPKTDQQNGTPTMVRTAIPPAQPVTG